ncbi:DUF5691 domain-containing protein [Sphaerotilus sp.]|uniref:DUF5691 domain-containing protein n=1 Tax=Sphaerotilus sp. TaxID=2093942 RepID=UPI002ACE4059|nr:DUF5691 domain-containing protein [Sphaerotilus sp.]MDZ7856989.1 DUF5691 domain-containing protein [Sphaerotilus sp.]
MTGPMMDRLLPIALVGTERSPGLRALLREVPAPLTGLMQALATAPEDDATVLLRAAGVLAVAQRVGGGLAAVDTLPEAPEPARPETRPALSAEPHQALLQRLLGEDVPDSLRVEALSQVAQRGWRLPATLLPPMLALALRLPVLRPAVGAVMGERGRWLVQQQPRWRSIVERPATPTEDDWAHGSGAARLAFLQAERRRDPDAARERLSAELPSLAARERTELVEALAVGLSAADEPLLVKLLRDRGGEVRTLAAMLLVRLPDSEQSAWLAGQWSALLRVESAWLGLKKRWHIEPPAAEDPAWKTRALDLQRPRHDGLGERGWWLYQLARLTVPAFWTAHTGMAPAELIDWARGTDWKDALLRGWREAVLATAGSAGVAGEPDAQTGAVDVRWLLALLACREAPGWPAHEVTALRSHLPLAARTSLWRDRLGEACVEVATEVVQTCAQPLIDGRPERAAPLDPTLAAALSAAMVRELSALFSGRTPDERRTAAWLDVAPALVGWLPMACLDPIEALPAPAPLPADTHVWLHARIVTLHDRLQQAVALRRAFHALPVAAVSSSTDSR